MSKHKSHPFTDPRDTWQNRARQSAEAKTGKVSITKEHRRSPERVYQYVDRITWSTYNNVYYGIVGSITGRLPLHEFNPGDYVECEGQVRNVLCVNHNPYWGATLEFAEIQVPLVAYARDCKLVGGPW